MKALHRWRIEHQIETSLHATDRFLFSATELQNYLVDDHELEINGQLYDIIHQEDLDGQILIYAYHDQDEEEMNRHLREGLNDNDAAKSEKSKTDCIQKLLSLTYVVPAAENQTAMSVRLDDQYSITHNHICQFYLFQYFPPPEENM
jgi:hypothetical protein